MATTPYESLITAYLDNAGIQLNGSEDTDIIVHDERFFKRVISEGSLGLGESYMQGWWSCRKLDGFFHKILLTDAEEKIRKNLKNMSVVLLARLRNQQTQEKSLRVAEQHYNLDNAFYRDMLGPTMSYTCAYWKDATTLEQAQEQKHDLICRKLNLKPGEKVLELGCGWGGFARFAAEHYGVHMTSINIASEQVKYAREVCRDFPVTIIESDYREVSRYNPQGLQFDKIVSIGMCEHVGYKNYEHFLSVAAQNLKEEGLFLLHTIGGNKFTTKCDAWTNHYIFPGGVLPSIQGLGKALENRFVMEDWHNFGAYYDPTLMTWYQNFVTHWDEHKTRFDDRFYKMWTYYLCSCAGMFRARAAELWQLVLSKGGMPGGYTSVR